MPRGRSPRKAASVRTQSIRQAVSHVEMLEERRLLTTLQGGETFNYLDASNHVVRIKLYGNITAEFIGARVRADNTVVIRDLQAALPPNTGAGSGATPDGVNLFEIYIAQADKDAQIVISSVPSLTAPDTDATPYTGTVGALRVFSNAINTPEITPDATGDVFIGAKTRTITNVTGSGDLPIISNRRRAAIGVRPAGRSLYAGIQTAPGVSMGKILIGGTITGIVNIAGSIGTLYAGNILTGDLSGLTDLGDRTTVANNFQVGGDLQNLIVSGSIGTVGSGAAARLYRTGVDMRIGGSIGYTHVGNNYQGSLEVVNSPDATHGNVVINELEYRQVPTGSRGDAFLNGDLLTGDTSLLTGDSVNNDTAATGQFASPIGTNQSITFSGSLQSLPLIRDFVDNYSVPLLAGQTITTQLTTGSLDPRVGGLSPFVADVGVYDPLGRLIATDFGGPTRHAANAPFQFTAKEPGVYRFAIASADNTTFNAASSPDLGLIPYSLTVSNVGNLPVGGVRVDGDTTFREPGIGVAVRTGDLGAWVGGGEVAGDTTLFGLVPSDINASHGNIREIAGATLGNETNVDPLALEITAPRGSIGYLLSTGVMRINPDAADLIDDAPVEANAVGGNIQRVEAGGSLIGSLVANGSIGTIVAGSVDNRTINFGDPNPVFSANTDNRGNDGGIDAIYVTGDFGSASTGGPGIYSGPGGNLKYLHVGGTAYRDREFGGSLTNQITLAPGASYTVVDDSGARGIVIPTILTTGTALVPVTGSVQLDGTTGTTTGTGTTGTTTGTASANVTTVTDPVTGETTTTNLGLQTITSVLSDPIAGLLTTTITKRDPTTGLLVTTTTTQGALSLIVYGVRDGGVAVSQLNSTTGVTVTGQTGSGSIDITDLNTSQNFISAGTTGGTTQNNLTGTPVISSGNGATGVGFANLGTTTTGGITQNTTAPAIANSLIFNGNVPINIFHVSGNDVTGLFNSTDGEVVSANLASIGYMVAQNIGTASSRIDVQVAVPTNLTGVAAGPGTTTTNGTTTNDDITDTSGATADFPYNGFSRGIDITGSAIGITSRQGIGNVRVGGTAGTISANADGRNTQRVFEGISGAVVGRILDQVNIGEGVGFGGTGVNSGGGVFATLNLVRLAGSNADIRGPVISEGTIGQITLNDGSIVNTFVGTAASFREGTFTTTGRLLPETNTGFSLNSISITGNGGILGSTIEAGSFNTINVDGYGIIASEIGATASNRTNGSITAGGLGIRSSLIDPGTSLKAVTATGNGRVLNVLNFESNVLQSAAGRHQKFDAQTGLQLSGSNDLNKILGTSRTNPAISGVTNSGFIEDTTMLGTGDLGTVTAYAMGSTEADISTSSPNFPMRIAFSNSIDAINITNSITGLNLTTGKLNDLSIGNTLQRATLVVAGEVGSVRIGRYFRGTGSLTANGPQGSIDSVFVKRALYGSIVAQNNIGTITAGSLASTIAATGAIGGISVTDDILSSANIRSAHTIGSVIVGGDVDAGATIDSTGIGRFKVRGTNSGTIVTR